MQSMSRWIALASVGGSLAMSLPSGGCSSSSTQSGDGGLDAAPDRSSSCGNGIVEPGEECDPGPDAGPATVTGCNDCTWFCIADTLNGDALCDDHNPCNGTEKCAGAKSTATPHTCAKGTPLAEGASCGMGVFCHGGMCAAGVCGDGVVDPGEECDQGSNNGTGMGCETSCMFTCVSSDSTRNCAVTSACAGPGTCDDTTHVCAPGTPAADGTACGAGAGGQVCVAGACVLVDCGDGVVEPPEQCDFGPGNGIGTGCEGNCTFSCTLSPNSCVSPDICAGANVCTAVVVSGASGQKCERQAAPADGTACAVGGMCQNQLCATANCGNGKVDTGEECDWGQANVAGSGCEPDCTFSCSSSSLSTNVCTGIDPCSASPQACQAVAGPAGVTNGGKHCVAATALASCGACPGGDICVANVCEANRCGDGCVVAPETCDPPNGTTCDSSCHAVVCGDGILEGAEQCDDGNTTNLDGCDSNCNFEQEMRTTSLVFFGSTDAFCTTNALGSQAITATGLGAIQKGINADVIAGVTNMIFKFTGSGAEPADLTGTTGPVTLGSLAGVPQDADAGADGGQADGGGYRGNSDVDWWYTVDPTMIDPVARTPLTALTGTYANKTLTTTSGEITVKMNLSGSAARLDLWGARLQIVMGTATAPAMSSNGMPPGHLASEHIKPGLMSCQTAGVGSNGPTGELCGNTRAASFAAVVCPAIIATGGEAACDEGYTAANSLLDVFVGGCSSQGVGIINATQPDQTDPTATFPAGTTKPYRLSASGSAAALDTCKDSSTPPKTVPLATCLAGLAYSSDFQFQSDRVIVK